MRPSDSTQPNRRTSSFTALSVDECLELLASRGIGRVGFSTTVGPQIHPVNYVVHESAIVIRTSPYAPLGEHPHGLVAFEIDEFDPSMRSGWSVLVVGTIAPVEDPDEAIDIRRSRDVQPWAPGQRNLFVRITPRDITGRRIR